MLMLVRCEYQDDDRKFSLPQHREVSKLLRAQETSPVEIIDACLARIDTINPT